MSEPTYDEIEAFLSVSGANLTWWQKAAVHAIAESKGNASFAPSSARGYGKQQAERWSMWASHHFDRHVHFIAGDQYPERPGICTKPTESCLEAGWTPYDPEEMKP